MKKISFASFALLLIFVTLVGLASCTGKKNQPTSQPGTGSSPEVSYGFHVKTPATESGKEVTNVIEVKAEKKTYEGDGDIHVMARVGFGHLPGTVNFDKTPKDILRVECVIIKEPFAEDKRPSWENITEYEGSWSNEKYNSTEKDAKGEFYPTYSDEIELVFPAEVERGYLVIRLINVFEDESSSQFESLKIYFEHKDGILTLNP